MSKTKVIVPAFVLVVAGVLLGIFWHQCPTTEELAITQEYEGPARGALVRNIEYASRPLDYDCVENGTSSLLRFGINWAVFLGVFAGIVLVTRKDSGRVVQMGRVLIVSPAFVVLAESLVFLYMQWEPIEGNILAATALSLLAVLVGVYGLKKRFGRYATAALVVAFFANIALSDIVMALAGLAGVAFVASFVYGMYRFFGHGKSKIKHVQPRMNQTITNKKV